MYCKKCGYQITENDKFCPKCGAVQNDRDELINDSKNEVLAEPSSKIVKKKNKIVALFLVAVILFVSLAGGAGYYFKYKDIVFSIGGYGVSVGVYNCCYNETKEYYNDIDTYGDSSTDISDDVIHKATIENIRKIVALRNLFVKEGLSINSDIQKEYIDNKIETKNGEYRYTEDDSREYLMLKLSAQNYYGEILRDITDDEIKQTIELRENSKDYYRVDVASFTVIASSEEEAMAYLNNAKSEDEFIKSHISYLKSSGEFGEYYGTLSESELNNAFSASKVIVKDLTSEGVKNWVISSKINDTYVDNTGDNTFTLYMKCSDLYLDNENSYVCYYSYTENKIDESDSIVDYLIQTETDLSKLDFSYSEQFVDGFNNYVLEFCSNCGDQLSFNYGDESTYNNIYFIRKLEYSYYRYAFEDLIIEKINDLSNDVRVVKGIAYRDAVPASLQ